MRKISILAVLIGLAALSGCAAPPPPGWCTAADGYKMWQSDPGHVRILDVRTPEEFFFIGHAPMAGNIPFQFLGNEYDRKHHVPRMEANPYFLEDVRKACKGSDPNDTKLLVLCSNGVRGNEAAEMLRKDGFANVLTIQGGFEGQYKPDCNCAGKGELLKPGWTQQNLPWTMWINADQVYARSRPTSSLQLRPATRATSGPATARSGG
jgi:rhodanese-related sulfurtransferase